MHNYYVGEPLQIGKKMFNKKLEKSDKILAAVLSAALKKTAI